MKEKPRPFLRPALDKAEPQIRAQVELLAETYGITYEEAVELMAAAFRSKTPPLRRTFAL